MINRLIIWRAIFLSFSHREVTDLKNGDAFGVGVEMLSDGMLGVCLDMLLDENINGLVTMMTSLEFTLSAP